LQQKFPSGRKQGLVPASRALPPQKSPTNIIQLRGKSSFLKDLRSNSDNWNKIEAKVLYLIQLWYDAFILDESVYNNIIDNYKILRKEGVIFPPRSAN
jgi:hypothetical protein